MSLFSRIQAAHNALVGKTVEVETNNSVQVDLDGRATVKVKFGIADVKDIVINEEYTPYTIGDVIKSALVLNGVGTEQEYKVLLDGKEVDSDEEFISGSIYKIVYVAGEAG